MDEKLIYPEIIGELTHISAKNFDPETVYLLTIVP